MLRKVGMLMTEFLSISVAFAGVDRQMEIPLQVIHPCTLEKAIQESTIQTHFPDIDWSIMRVGIFNKVMPLTSLVRDGDRIEIYRPLVKDPKDARRARFKRALLK